MNVKTEKRKYFTGTINFAIDGTASARETHEIFDNEIVSYDGDKKLVINRDGTIYDLSEYSFNRVEFHAPNSKSTYGYVNGAWQKINVVATIYGGLKKSNFVFQDHLKYDCRDKNGHYFESLLTNKRHYVTGKDFDNYFVPHMDKGNVSGKFTYAKHGAMCWLTLVTD